MDWPTALEHLPWSLVVTDRKGRVLLISGEVPNVRVGRSFLKLAHEDEIMKVGRMAKRALKDGEPRKLPSVPSSDGGFVSLRLIPFTNEAGESHLLVVLDDPQAPQGLKEIHTPPPARRWDEEQPTDPPVAPPKLTPQPAARRIAPPVPPPTELVVVGAGGTLPLAKAVTTILQGEIKASAWPVSRFVDALSARAGRSDGQGVERAVDPATRVLYIGDTPWSRDIAARPLKGSDAGHSAWAIGGLEVRCAAAWAGETGQRPGDLLADVQFEMMEIVRRAMPVRRHGHLEPVPKGLKLASVFLEHPAAMDTSGDLESQARYQQLVVSIARFLEEGLDELLHGE